MKFSERMDSLHKMQAQADVRLPNGERRRRDLTKKADVAHRRAERTAKAREMLSEADRALAETVRLPRTREGRVELAKKLRGPNAERTLTEVGAIMGVSKSAIALYLDHPKGTPPRHISKAKRQGRAGGAPLNPALQQRMETTGEWIRRGRKRVNISQASLARTLGIPAKKLASWEHDEESPGPTMAAAIKAAFESS